MTTKESGKPIALDAQTFASNPRAWCLANAPRGERAWLLGFADDGLFWGLLQNQTLTLSNEVFEGYSAALTPITVQRLFIFNEQGETRLWKIGISSFCAAKIEDPRGPLDIEDADLILWGTEIFHKTQRGFTLLQDGAQGLRHAPPLELTGSDFAPDQMRRPVRLTVRQYVDYDEDGQAFVSASRLVKVWKER